MSSWKKAAKANQKTHKERHQPESRKHLGLLEKKKDYKKRADDYHEKGETLKLLRKRTLDKNPDEFYFHMINSRVKDGEHHEVEKEDEHTPQQVKLMQTQDIKYINMKRTIETKKINKLQAQLHMTDVAEATPNTHTFFVDVEEVEHFDVAKRLDTHPTLLNRKSNRPRLADLDKIALPELNDEALETMNKKKQKTYSELSKRIKREKELTVIQQKMELKRHLQDVKIMKPKRLKPGTKGSAPVYQFQYMRKKYRSSTVGMIEDMPRGTPLETPLHAKRRRNLPKDRVDFNKPKSSGSTFLKSVWTETTTSTLQSPTPLQPEPHIQPSTSTAHILSAPPPIAHIQPSTSTAHILSAPSSPTAHDECEMLTTPTAAQISQPCRRPSRDDQNNDILRYGSEEEYEAKCSDDCGEPQLMPMPRSFRVLLAPDEDTPQEADAAGIVESTPVESGVMHGPISLFDFDWQAFPTPPISPHLRREKFVGSSGPMIGPILSPYEAFILIWDRSIMEHIAHETNIYAQQYAVQLLERGEIGPSSRIADWRDTDVDELYIYFGLMIAMGVLVKSKLEEYWSTDRNIFSTPGFRVNMTLRRFQLLSRCLHFNNNANVPSDIPSRSQAKIYKIKPIVDHLNSKFSSLYGLDQNIALDESLTQWKGLLEINQFIRHKAAEVGIKTYEVCESRTGYLWRFEVHVGGETEDQQVVIPGIIPNLVLRLLRGLEHRGHTVFMDNYYNSPALARVLKSIGYDCVGTLRTNRQFVPDEVKDLKKSEMRVGQVCGCTSGDVDVMVWRDLNRVAMISTYHGNAASENKPILIKDYNVCMGGVDKKDQMLSKYPMERKQTQIWYKKFFKRLLNVSVLNAYILYKHTHHTEHRDFRMSLVTEILQKHEQSRPDIGLRMVHGAPKFSAEVISHLPSRFPVLSGDNRMGRSRRRCVVCKVRTMYHCRACDVALCFSFEDTNSSCYIKHHK